MKTKSLELEAPASSQPPAEPVGSVGPERRGDSGHFVSLFERLARDPVVPVDKLERLIELQERILRHEAKAAFDTAYALMQGDIPEISERGEIVVNGQVRSTYATNEDIQREVKPILQRHGFALRFRSEFLDGSVKTIGILSHRSGHSEQDEFVAAADTSGSKNALQALGSTRSYGQRYCTTALLNIATREPAGRDDDGQSSDLAKAPAAPEGLDAWLTDMTAVADNGEAALREAWNKSKATYREYLSRHRATVWAQLKAKALKVKG